MSYPLTTVFRYKAKSVVSQGDPSLTEMDYKFAREVLNLPNTIAPKLAHVIKDYVSGCLDEGASLQDIIKDGKRRNILIRRTLDTVGLPYEEINVLGADNAITELDESWRNAPGNFNEIKITEPYVKEAAHIMRHEFT